MRRGRGRGKGTADPNESWGPAVRGPGTVQMDTMTGVKVVGGLCGTFLIFLLGGWAAEEIYHVGSTAHAAEGEEGHAQAYSIEVASAEGGGEEEAGVPFEEVFAAADASAGESVFRQCASCHKLEDGANATGPSLYGIVGREQGIEPGYAYSSSFAELDGTWTPEELNHFLEDPAGWVPGTKMTYRGLGKVEDRANIIAYLQTVGG